MVGCKNLQTIEADDIPMLLHTFLNSTEHMAFPLKFCCYYKCNCHKSCIWHEKSCSGKWLL